VSFTTFDFREIDSVMQQIKVTKQGDQSSSLNKREMSPKVKQTVSTLNAEPTLSVTTANVSFRFSGHQTFPLRIAWIPKVVAQFQKQVDPFSNPDVGILKLGLGKNMVEALHCWIEAFQIAHRDVSEWNLTEIGKKIFGEQGLDPYLEDPSTLWTLHWLITTNRKAPFWAWECLFNRWTSPEFTAAEVLASFRRQANLHLKPASDVTLKQHWEVFLHTYRPPHSAKGEDHLDSALACLSLIQEAGESISASGRPEPRYRFNPSERTSIPQQLFAFFLNDWWSKSHPNEATVSFRDVLTACGSPGRVLKMSEKEVAARLQDLARSTSKTYEITESANLRQIRKKLNPKPFEDFCEAYKNPRFMRFQ
jgi:hypothetical protein